MPTSLLYPQDALEEAGFKHGNISLVGRRLPECACVWEGAPLDIHYANRYNRLLPGDMDFIEIPHTVDIDSRMWGGKHAQDLCVELVDAKNHWYTIYKAVMRQKNDVSLPVKVIRGVTHNTFDYSDPDNFRRQTLVGMIEAVKNILDNAGCELKPATLATIVDDFRKKVPKIDPKDRLKLDRRGYQNKKTV